MSKRPSSKRGHGGEPTSPTGPDQSSASKGARLGLIGVIAAAAIAGVATIIGAIISHDHSSPRPTSSATSITVIFTKPAATTVQPGTDVTFKGVVKGLSPGQVLWLISRTPSSRSLYYIVGDKPVAVRDGAFEATAFGLGDKTDLGSFRTFFGVAADAACSDALATGVDEKPRAVAGLADTCQIIDPAVKVSFTSR